MDWCAVGGGKWTKLSWSLAGGALLYVVGVLLAARGTVPKHTSAIGSGPAMVVYNFVQVALSVAQTGTGVAMLLQGHLGTAFLDIRPSTTAEYLLVAHIFNKVLDWWDTFLILQSPNPMARKRRLSFLHVFHHATIPLVWLVVLAWGQSHVGVLGVTLNSIVHAAMYLHYAAAAMGVKNPFKYWLTTIQRLQFVACLVQALVALAFGGDSCVAVGLLQSVYMCAMLVLFASV
jgi:hypothetical protein